MNAQHTNETSVIATSGNGAVTHYPGGAVTMFEHDDASMQRQLERSIDRLHMDKWTPFDPEAPALSIGCDIQVRGIGSDITFTVGYLDHANKFAYCYKDVSVFSCDASRPTKVPYNRIVAYDATESLAMERVEYLKTLTARKDFSRSDLEQTEMVWCPLANDRGEWSPSTSVWNVTSYCAKHPNWKPVLGYELDVCQCGKHATSYLHGVVKKGAEYLDITPRTGFAIMSGMRFFIPDPKLSETDLLFLRKLGLNGAFEGRDASVFKGPGSITFTPSVDYPCPEGLGRCKVVHNAINPFTGQSEVVEQEENWEVTRRALRQLRDNDVRPLEPGARSKAIKALCTKVSKLRIAACSECKIIDITHTEQRLCGACVGELPEDAFAKLKAKAEERERLEQLEAQLREAEEAAKKARSREQAALDAEAGVQRRIADARPTPQPASKKKGKAADRATRRAENRLTAEELAFDVDKNPAYVEGKARDKKLRKEREEAELYVATVKAAIKAERARIAEAGARLEAARHAVPQGPKMSDFLAQALANAESA